MRLAWSYDPDGSFSSGSPFRRCFRPAVRRCHLGHCSETVDVELVLAVDVSLSMSPDELEIQRDGYAAALTDRVLQAIADGVHGKIAVTYFEWAGNDLASCHRAMDDHRHRADAERVASQAVRQAAQQRAPHLDFGSAGIRRRSVRRKPVSRHEAGDRHFRRRPEQSGARRSTSIRDAVVEQGITINGLPLMTNGGLTSAYDVEDLDQYYADCVIGGPGAFMIPVNDWSQFPEAIRRKLVLELAVSRVAQANAPCETEAEHCRSCRRRPGRPTMTA